MQSAVVFLFSQVIFIVELHFVSQSAAGKFIHFNNNVVNGINALSPTYVIVIKRCQSSPNVSYLSINYKQKTIAFI